MTQKDKELLLIKDLCARLPYRVKCEVYNCIGVLDEVTTFYGVGVTYSNGQDTTCRIDECKPYLIPLSSMDDELKNVIKWKLTTPLHDSFDEDSLEDLLNNSTQVVNYCYEHHLDINGLIERGLALEAPEGMYN